MTRIFTYIFVLFAAAGIFAQNVNNKLMLANNYVEAGKYDEAERIYKEVIEIQPNNQMAVKSLNDLYLAQKEYGKSVNLLEERINEQPRNINLYGMLGTTWYTRGDVDKAFAAWDEGISQNAESLSAYRIMANFAISSRAFDKGIGYLQQGKNRSQDPGMFSLDLGNLYSSTMKYEQAAEEYAELLEARPEQIHIVKQRMAGYIENNGAAEPTIEVFGKFYDMNTGEGVFADMMVYLYSKTGNYAEAFNLVKDIDERKNNGGADLYNFGMEARNAGRFETAYKAFDLLLNRYPESPMAPGARIAYTQTLTRETDNRFFEGKTDWKPIGKTDTSRSYLYEPALESFAEISEKYKANDLRNSALYESGRIYLERYAAPDRAKEYFETIVNEAPLSQYAAAANRQLGEIAVLNGEAGEAKNYFTRAASGRAGRDEANYAKYRLAQLEFWGNNIGKSKQILSGMTKTLEDDQANDALQFSMLLSLEKTDSAALVDYAAADYLIEQKKFKKADSILTKIVNDENVFMLNKIAAFRLSQVKIAENDLPAAIALLEELTSEDNEYYFSDKALVLLGDIYYYGIKDFDKALSVYRKLLDNFPNSLYLDRSREMINIIQNERV